MKNCMLYTADIHIYWKVFVCFFSGYQFFVVFVIHIAEEIPGRTCPLRHGIGLSLGWRTTAWASGIYPLINSSQRRFSCAGRLIGFYFWKSQRKLVFRNRYVSAFWTVNDGNRLAPVTLTGEYPVTKLIIYCLSSDSHLLDHFRSFFLQNCRFHAVPVSGVDHSSGSFCISLCHIFDFFSVLSDYLDDRNIEFCCKFKVTVIMSRYTHDSSCTIISQYVIRKPDRHFLSIKWIDGVGSCEYAGLLFILKTVYVRLHRSVIDIFFYSFSCLICSQAFCQSMFRSQYHKGCSMKGIRSCGIDSDLLVSSFYREVYLCTVRFSDPVCLHLFNLFRPVQFVQVI